MAVIHDTPLLALGVREALRDQPGLNLVKPGGETADAAADVVVTNHWQGLKHLMQRQAAARAKVLVVASRRREFSIREALERGVHGYLLLSCPAEELRHAIRAVARGQRALCREAAALVADSALHARLTRRELEVLQGVVHGRSNQAIANELALALGTVKTHIRAILDKLGVQSRTEAISVSHKHGLVAPLPSQDRSE